ncbi:MAG TPA: hypothetical protein VL551_34130 [Actinospica sp.]|nr:hypothetical protein [Actinospica sp.]
MTSAEYRPPSLPAVERAGFLVIRSLAECGTCEARSPWWYGDMPPAWPGQHAREQHPQQEASTSFRIWRIVRYGVRLEPDRLSRLPPADPAPEPAAFALSQCLACGQCSHWLTAEDHSGALAHFEHRHQRAAHPKAPARFDRWHLTRAADPEAGTRK